MCWLNNHCKKTARYITLPETNKSPPKNITGWKMKFLFALRPILRRRTLSFREGTWRIIPVSKWLVNNPPFISHEWWPFGRGPTTQPDPERGLTITMVDLTTEPWPVLGARSSVPSTHLQKFRGWPLGIAGVPYVSGLMKAHWFPLIRPAIKKTLSSVGGYLRRGGRLTCHEHIP